MNFKMFSSSFFKIFNLNFDKIELYYSTFSESLPSLFSLKKIFLLLEKIESFFLKEIKKQTEYEFQLHKSEASLKNVYAVFNDMIKKNNNELTFYSSSLNKNQKLFIDNVCFLETSCYVDFISLQIDNFVFDAAYSFELIIDKIVDGVYQQDKRKILPYQFSGSYLESLKTEFDFVSTFDCLNNYPIVFKNSSNDIVNVNYSVKDGKLFVSKADIFYEGLTVYYEPLFESTKVAINGKIVKTTLNTNFFQKSKKKLILIGADYNV